MKHEFNAETRMHTNRDKHDVVREVMHDEPQPTGAATAQQAAAEYLGRHADLFGLRPAELNGLALSREPRPVDAEGEFRLHGEKHQFDMATVTYDQTHFGLPVWDAGLTVHMKEKPYRVVSATSQRHTDLAVRLPEKAKLKRFEKLDAKTLAKILGLTARSKDFDAKTLKIDDVTLVIYRFEAAKRAPVPEPLAEAPAKADRGLRLETHASPTLPLPAVPRSIADGKHYVAAVVHFALGFKKGAVIHWRAIIAVESGAVLQLRAFVDDLTGMVFQSDPATSSGGPGPGATAAALNPRRTSVTLQGLIAPVSGTQSLIGNLIKMSDAEAPPTIAPPTKPSGVNFDFNTRTDNFSAVNAYYLCDRFFRLVQDLGFPLASYFGGATVFPNIVDHRGKMNTANGIEINAHCLGTAGGLGILRTTFALADLGDTTNPIGISCDWRVVLHELGGHGILYPAVHFPNFGFAHSAGDSFAAILNDPGTQAPDRFVTFPWVNIGRRHDRAVAAGWGWGGTNDVGGYSSEQILCTSHFRIYRSIGGDSTQINMQRFAARFVSYLILRTVGSLTPGTNPSTVSPYVTALLTADLGDWTTEGHAGGAYGKVIRWAFEKQGLFQPAGAPTPVVKEGAPPPVDVYIDDGRHGEYQYQPNHWNCQAIWNRRHSDGLTTHETPIVGVKNFAYVKIKNRGTQVATNVVVKAFHADPSAGLVYPNDWQPMTTAQLAAPNVAANNTAEIVVGPFVWTPSHVGHECMFMIVSAKGDPSNVNNLSAGESIPEWRLVPHDNNIGQRNVTPVLALNPKTLVAEFEKLPFVLKNPHRVAAAMMLNPILPRMLVDRGWKVEFTSAGGGELKLGAGETKQIAMRLVPGKTFTAAEIAKAKDGVIHVEAYADGILVGGMSYALDASTTTSRRGVKAVKGRAPARSRAAKTRRVKLKRAK